MALTDVIYQNTPGNSEGFPLGVPTSYSWYGGSTGHTGSTPPSNFTSVTGWGQVYPKSGATNDSNPANVQIADFQTWVHLKGGGWVLVQDQATDPIAGAQFLADFSGNTNSAWGVTRQADGSAMGAAPLNGYNDHFWPGSRGSYTAGTVDGVYVQANMRTTDPNEHLVADLGADWWLNPTAPYVDGFSNNPGAGMSDWVELTTSYQTLYFTSMTSAQLQADLPPPLRGTSAPTTPTQPTTPTTPTTPNVAPSVTQASASPGTGTEHVGDVVTLTLTFSEAVTVGGAPTLSLNDGAKATYAGGSGTNTLTFRTTVASTDTSTSALAITGVSLANGATIKDSGGLAANLAGAVKTFSGLQISTAPTAPTMPTQPTTPTTPTTPSTPTVTAPVLSVADNSLWVAGRGGQVDLGTKVWTNDPNDRVSLNIRGLPRYETITTGDGTRFRGDNITLSSAQVESGLTLTSYYRGNAHPVANLTLTASGTDPVTGAVTKAASQTITVTDPRPSSSSPSAQSLASQSFAQLLGSDTSTLASTAPQTTNSAWQDTAKASHASQSFALLNQFMAGSSGRVDSGQIVAALSSGTGWTQNSLLTKPQG
ncbi:hypothetical protein WDM22_09170 [Bradyrhizobium septentrionale]|uniref:hypothetical protein n=1 Tax=Bradyrhizobium septentrionale TaxID=1404411 RepID=UPI0030D5923C